jgi:3-hydroxymyristoyl/3-hydroxydecanoyl-(acyl carrier protein) dehydratase
VTWLSALPHQIPFRAASKVIRRDARSIEGTFLWTANEVMPPEIMLVEAMAQFAGGLVFEGQGFLTGIDGCEVNRAIAAGDVVDIHITLDADFGGTFRFSGTASIAGLQCGKGRFYLQESGRDARSSGDNEKP